MPTADYEVLDEDYEVWRKCGGEIKRWVMEKEGEERALYQKSEEMYGELINRLLSSEGEVAGDDYWFEPYV
ncbi:MAG: hypothetical protein JZD41_07645 [Thermoproteus sp.]|nr:hypothetical protein [Thermoproteus sp.]